MRTILALRGRAQCGKTSTIGILHQNFPRAQNRLIRSTFVTVGQDFIAVFSRILDGKFVGVTSCGDTHDLVHDAVAELTRDGCEVCVCACRTYDRVPPGTNAAVLGVQGYDKVFVDKTIESVVGRQGSSNKLDADRLMQQIALALNRP